MLKKTFVFVVLFVLALAASSHADEVISGKIVGVADGDTITLLESTPSGYSASILQKSTRHSAKGPACSLLSGCLENRSASFAGIPTATAGLWALYMWRGFA